MTIIIGEYQRETERMKAYRPEAVKSVGILYPFVIERGHKIIRGLGYPSLKGKEIYVGTVVLGHCTINYNLYRECEKDLLIAIGQRYKIDFHEPKRSNRGFGCARRN